MSAPDAFQKLPADPAHRFRAVLQAVRDFMPEGSAASYRPRLLDVGGFPCTFARTFHDLYPRWETVTVDTPDEQMEGYVAGSGMNLPFDGQSFDAVVTIDCFEHIPAEERRRFVSELCRVARHLVVLAAPFHHPATETVERLLNTAHERLFQKPHPWLHEHVSFGLPRVPEALGAWPSEFRVREIRPSYGLGAWTTWQAMQLLAKARGELDGAFAAFDTASATGPIPAIDEVAYRRVFVATRGAKFPVAVAHEPSEAAGAAAIELARLYCRLLEMTAADQHRSATAAVPLAVEARIKEGLAAAEKELEALRQRTQQLAPSPGLLKRIFKS